jgi:hypothetical protein
VAPTTEVSNTAALELQEALASRPSALQDDGTVHIHVIRPTIGQGLGRHKYTPEMLRENADVFTGWKMYIDHQSPEARKAAGGLPRSIRDLGGRILESWWDDSVPAEGRFGQGAVIAKVKPVGQVKRLIEEDPELLEASIRAKATEVHAIEEGGEQVWVVEGIRQNPPGSVDWVSEGGAGGRVADLIEGLVAEEVDESANEHAEGGDIVKELEEALRDPESGASQAVRELVAERTAAAIKVQAERHKRELEEARAAAVEEGAQKAIEEAQELAKAAERKIELRDLRDEAHKLISESALPSKAEAKLKSEYSLEGDAPTAKLDVFDTENKSAADILKESVDTDIREARELLAEVMPAKVEGQGPSNSDGEVAPAPVDKPFYQEFLEEAGIDPEVAYGNNTDKESV